MRAYLHIPFCSRVCPYCDFKVLTGTAASRERFVDALVAEIALAGAGDDRAFDTIYLGGGTPSLLTPDQLERVLEAIGRHLDAAGAALHLEANPEDVDGPRLAAWRAAAVRFVSVGVQSFSSPALAFLGRRHGPDDARRAVRAAREAGLDTVSLDLIYGLPDDTEERWRADLDAAIALEPDHLSCYQLTLHESTPFGRRHARGALEALADDAQAALFRVTHEHLAAAGYEPYEVSNFARSPRHRSRHNQKYWDHSPYLGLGPSAHSLAGNRRWWNERVVRRYEAEVEGGRRPIAGAEDLTAADLRLEAVMLGLRTAAGIDLEAFRERFDLDLLERNRSLLARLEDEGRVSLEGARLRPTTAGLAVADGIAAALDISSS